MNDPSVPQADVDSVLYAYSGFVTDDLEVLLPRVLHDDVRWSPSERFPDQRIFNGCEEVRGYIDMFRELFDDFWMKPDELFTVAGKIVVPLHIGGRGRDSGIEIDAAYVHVWTMRDGRAETVETYVTRTEALEALGVDPQHEP